MAITGITHVSVYVKDQQEALDWYVANFGFEKQMDDDTQMPGFRWLTVAPAGNPSTQFVLMPAMAEDHQTRVGTNGMTVLGSSDCRADCQRLGELGVEIVEQPTQLPWGWSAIVKDLYGNPYNLVESSFQ